MAGIYSDCSTSDMNSARVIQRRRFSDISKKLPCDFARFVAAIKQTSLSFIISLLPLVVAVDTIICLQCFDAVGWAAGRASGL